MDGTRDIELEPPEVEFGPSGRRVAPEWLRGRAWLALVSLLAAVLAVQLWREHRQSGPERAAAEVIEAYTAGWNAHDLARVHAVLAPGATFASAEILEYPLFTVGGTELDTVLAAMFDAGVSLETTGRYTVVGDGPARATLPQRFHYRAHGLSVVEDGTSLFTLVIVDGATRIAQHVWWRPQGPGYPSMLWVVEDLGLNP